MSSFIFPPTVATVDTGGLATEAKQDTIITDIEAGNAILTSLDAKDFATETTLASLDAKDFATETTLASLDAKDFATETTLAAQAADIALIEAKDFATETTLAAQAADIALIEAKDFATQTTLAAFSAKTKSADVTEAHDYKAFTYVAAGNGIGQVETITYKLGGAGGSTVAVQTFTYDASDRVASITKS